MALRRTGLQPVGTVPQYAKTSGNAYSKYGSSSSEQKNDKGGMDPGMVNAGILGAMAGKAGYDWANSNGYLDPIKDRIGMSDLPNAYDTSIFKAQNAQGNGFSSANPMADFNAGMGPELSGPTMAGMPANQAAQVSQGMQTAAEMTPEMMLQFGAMA